MSKREKRRPGSRTVWATQSAILAVSSTTRSTCRLRTPDHRTPSASTVRFLPLAGSVLSELPATEATHQDIPQEPDLELDVTRGPRSSGFPREVLVVENATITSRRFAKNEPSHHRRRSHRSRPEVVRDEIGKEVRIDLPGRCVTDTVLTLKRRDNGEEHGTRPSQSERIQRLPKTRDWPSDPPDSVSGSRDLPRPSELRVEEIREEIVTEPWPSSPPSTAEGATSVRDLYRRICSSRMVNVVVLAVTLLLIAVLLGSFVSCALFGEEEGPMDDSVPKWLRCGPP